MSLKNTTQVMFSILRDENKDNLSKTKKIVNKLGIDMPNNLLKLADEAQDAQDQGDLRKESILRDQINFKCATCFFATDVRK